MFDSQNFLEPMKLLIVIIPCGQFISTMMDHVNGSKWNKLFTVSIPTSISTISKSLTIIGYSKNGFQIRKRNGFYIKCDTQSVTPIKCHTQILSRGESRIPTVKLKIPGKAFLKSELYYIIYIKTLFIFFTIFHGSVLAKSQPLPLVDS